MLPNSYLNRNKKDLILIFLIVLAAAAIYTHKKPANIHNSNYKLFAGYIESYTTGIISRHKPIQIRLASDVPTLQVGHEEIKEELFQFSPTVKGKAYWIDSRTIEFRPDTVLNPATTYRATFKMPESSGLPEKSEKFKFEFETIKSDFDISFRGLHSSSSRSKGKMKLEGFISTSDQENPNEIQNLLKADLGAELKISWVHNPESKIHNFSIEDIERADAERKLKVNYDGEVMNVDRKGSEVFSIPALNDFKVLDLKVIQENEQYVSIIFSDPIRIGQELTGLLGISNSEMPAYAINANEVKLYPSAKMDGNHTVFVNEGIENFEGKKLGTGFSGNLIFQNNEPSVSIPGQGVILPHSGRLMMPFEAINLNAVDVSIIKIYGNNIPQYLQQNKIDGSNQLRQVAKPVKQVTIKLNDDKSVNLHKKNRFMLDIDKLIRTEPGAIYRITIGYRPSYSIYSCKEQLNDNSADEERNGDYEEEYYEGSTRGVDEDDEFWDRYDNYYPFGYNWNEKDDPCSSSYYNKERWASRNVLASNIGLIAKQGNNNSFTVAVTNILSANPLPGVELEFLDYQKQIIGKATSGTEGIVELNLPRKPYLLVAKKGDERGYLKLEDASSLSLSRFDVGGEQIQKGLKGFIYGERGVWRPGDSLYLTFILDDKQNKLPSGHPIDFELYNPQGQLFQKITSGKSVNGFYSFRTATDQNSPTGNWLAKVKAGGAVFEKRIRIETIMPNRLKVNLSFNKNLLSKDEGIKGVLKSEWLFGGAARNLTAKIDAFVSSRQTAFAGYEKFIFDDPTRPFNSQLQNVYDGRLDGRGLASINTSINLEQQAPGMLNASFMVKVFEPGGNFSINQISLPYSPYSSYTGIKAPEGEPNSGMLVTDRDHMIDLVSVDADGRLTKGSRSLEVEIYKVKWRWWWDEEENSVSNFTQDEYNNLISTYTVQVVNGRGATRLRINQPDWGRYLIRVRDPQSGHSSGKFIYVDWPNWTERLQKENPTEASMISFTSDKPAYKVGETVKLSIPSGNAGRGLVSIENGSRVLKTFWFDSNKGQTVVKFKVDKEMTPNVFVNVTLLQPHSQTVNDLPIRMYGVIPIQVEDPATVLKPVIRMPDEIRPETPVSISVAEADGKPMTYTIAIVDEGLLDISNFETPDPHASFYAREGLGVKTWDMFDYVIGAYGGDLQRILSIGGDRQSGKGGKNPNANRFKPVVKFLGPFKSDGSAKKHSFKLPQYVGSVKVMVIAGDKGAFGNAEKSVKVKKPLMVLATMPRVLAPGEQLKLPVAVFAMNNAIKNVTIEVLSKDFNYPAGHRRSLNFSQPGDQMSYVDLSVRNISGIARLKIIARSGREIASHDIEIDVRNPSPVVTEVIEKQLPAGATSTVTFKPFGTSGSSKATVELSAIPPINLEKRLGYLIQYPYGCLEQTTSSAFPQLYLSQLVDLSPAKLAQVERNVKAAISRLNGFRTPEGGLSYWPGNAEADEWSTNYASHFLIEAESKGYSLPPGLLTDLKKFQKAKALSWSPSTTSFYGADLTQAYRLYVLALAKSPELGSMNRLKEFKYLSAIAKWRLAAAYRLSGQAEVALQLIRNLPRSVKPYRQMWETYGSDIRDAAMILETSTLLNQRAISEQLLQRLAARLSAESWLSTQETAYSLISISKYCGTSSPEKRMQFQYQINNAKADMKSGTFMTQIPVKLLSSNSVFVKNTGKNKLFFKVIIQGQPTVGQNIKAISNPKLLSMRVGYFDLKGQLLDPSTMPQGTDFVAQVNISNPGKRGDYHNLALSQLFPSGWEIINTRLMNNDEVFKSSGYDYKDIRDDRVNTFFSLGAQKESTFFVLLNAAYTGKFYLPPSQCQAMYDGSITASTKGQWVEVSANVK